MCIYRKWEGDGNGRCSTQDEGRSSVCSAGENKRVQGEELLPWLHTFLSWRTTKRNGVGIHLREDRKKDVLEISWINNRIMVLKQLC